jgi:distribution and morphology protein 12
VHHSASSPDLRARSGRGGGGGGGRGHARQASSGSILSVGDEVGSPPVPHVLREKHSVSTLAPTSAGTSRPPTRENDEEEERERERTPGLGGEEGEDGQGKEEKPRFREPRVEDMQAVFRIRYAGDLKLLLTADILLDYPMPSFVGIPVRLSITGLTFDGVGVLAKIRKRAHFCFLSPEDAVAAVGGEENKEEIEGEQRHGNGGGRSTKMGGLLQEIRVESEIGQREGGKQSLKNVGKVERFVLEQVRRIFEEEFVYPSFWTFLV